jgi:hypothetical protein
VRIGTLTTEEWKTEQQTVCEQFLSIFKTNQNQAKPVMVQLDQRMTSLILAQEKRWRRA